MQVKSNKKLPVRLPLKSINDGGTVNKEMGMIGAISVIPTLHFHVVA